MPELGSPHPAYLAGIQRESAVPKLNLSQYDGTVDPLAGARLLALMTYPGDRRRRYRFVEAARTGETPAGSSHGSLLEAGAAVGDLLLYMLQDHYLDKKRQSLNAALPLVAAAILHDRKLPLEGLGPLEKRENPQADLAKLGTRRIGRPALLADFHCFRPVAHFWAARVYVGAYGVADDIDFLKPRDVPDDAIERLARFIGTSHHILDLTAPILLNRNPREPLLGNAWRIRLPDSIRVPRLDIKLPPIGPAAEGVRRRVIGN